MRVEQFGAYRPGMWEDPFFKKDAPFVGGYILVMAGCLSSEGLLDLGECVFLNC